jgi:hypothetical protein
MKLTTLTLATAAIALLGPAAYAQSQPAAPTPGSVTGDWNGAHAPSDEKQYKEKVVVPVGALPSATTTAQAEPLPPAPTVSATSTTEAPAAPAAGADVAATTSFSNITVTNGPVPDTAENRAKYGQPMSRAGKRTAARGN